MESGGGGEGSMTMEYDPVVVVDVVVDVVASDGDDMDGMMVLVVGAGCGADGLINLRHVVVAVVVDSQHSCCL